MKLKRICRTTINWLKKNRPTIEFVTGCVGMGAGIALACEASTHVPEVVEKHNEAMEELEEQKRYSLSLSNDEEACDKESRKDVAKVYLKTSAEFAKLYWPATIAIGGAYYFLIDSHRVLSKRLSASTAAYAMLSAGFKKYRDNIIAKYGENADLEANYDVKVKKNKNGETKLETTECTNVYEPSIYARFFDETNPNWEDDALHNLTNLKKWELYCNDKLQREGILFLNDVYKLLGFKPSKPGQVVGWVYNEKNPVGDNFVSFGIYDVTSPAKRDFVNGLEKAILLDFNVDGNVWELMN